MKKAVKIIVEGKVQGVGFRRYVQNAAQRLGICGFVQNQSDNFVYVEAEGDEDALNQFVDWCKIGPKYAQIVHFEIEIIPVKNWTEFFVKFN